VQTDLTDLTSSEDSRGTQRVARTREALAECSLLVGMSLCGAHCLMHIHALSAKPACSPRQHLTLVLNAAPQPHPETLDPNPHATGLTPVYALERAPISPISQTSVHVKN